MSKFVNTSHHVISCKSVGFLQRVQNSLVRFYFTVCDMHCERLLPLQWTCFCLFPCFFQPTDTEVLYETESESEDGLGSDGEGGELVDVEDLGTMMHGLKKAKVVPCLKH